MLLSAAGCTANEPWRTEPPCTSPNCDRSFLVEHPDYDLAFVEFTERGNLFDRGRKNQVVDHVAELARSGEGVTAIVFVHGWKNNADVTNANVADFRDLLHSTSRILVGQEEFGGTGGRRVVGIYVGWRGLSVTAPLIKELSYWERKTVAEQVGKGGITELLIELERAVHDEGLGDPNKNLLAVIGHSFGGAIVLSALNEILLERAVSAPRVADCEPTGSTDCACVETRPFGHGVMLLNPAIEANEAFQLKQAVAERCFSRNQVRLMHVISSDADEATNLPFRVGQWLGMLNWRETELERKLGDRPTVFREHDLDTTTIGNYLPFQTGQLCARDEDGDEDRRPECRLEDRPAECVEVGPNWDYYSFVGRTDCVHEEDQTNHIPVASNEPLAFIQTDEAFIGGHNDVFTNHVTAYLAAVVAETMFKRASAEGRAAEGRRPRAGCIEDGDFDFGSCFQTYEALFQPERQS